MTELKITLGSIRAAHPCSDAWEAKALAYLNDPWSDTREVTFADIVASCGLDAALFCLRCLPKVEQWRVRLLARSYALLVVHLWDAPQVVKDWLTTGKEEFRGGAADTAAYAAANADARYVALSARGVHAAASYGAYGARAAAALYAYTAGPERDWQTQELLRVMSLDYSPEAIVLAMPKGAR